MICRRPGSYCRLITAIEKIRMVLSIDFNNVVLCWYHICLSVRLINLNHLSSELWLELSSLFLQQFCRCPSLYFLQWFHWLRLGASLLSSLFLEVDLHKGLQFIFCWPILHFFCTTLSRDLTFIDEIDYNHWRLEMKETSPQDFACSLLFNWIES